MSVIVDMRTRLLQYGFTTPIALARLPDQPDVILMLREYEAGPNKDFTAENLPVFEELAVQMWARVGKDQGVAAAQTIAVEAYRILSGRHLRINGNSYDRFIAAWTPAHLMTDELDRPIVGTNWRIQRWGNVIAPILPGA
jgi:hypothetical protein